MVRQRQTPSPRNVWVAGGILVIVIVLLAAVVLFAA